MKEKLQEFAQFAEIASAIAIVASLLFVGLQIQQNNQLSELEAYMSRTASIEATSRSIALSPDLAEIIAEYQNNGKDSLSDAERIRLQRWYFATLRSMQSSYYSFQQGYLDSAVKDAMINDAVLTTYQSWSDFGLLERFEIPEMREEIERAILDIGNP